MALADYKPTRHKIEFEGGSFEVRAITLMDVAVIVETHQYAIENIYNKVKAREGMEFTTDMVSDLVMEVVRESPTLVGHVIAMVTDERDGDGRPPMSIATTLPVTVQVQSLKAIGEMTFHDLGSAKKFAADVMGLIRGILPPATETLAAA